MKFAVKALLVAFLLLPGLAGCKRPNPPDTTQLSELVRQKRLVRLEALLKTPGIAIDRPDREGMTLLHWAARTGSATICDMLIERGASIGIRDESGYSPLDRALEMGHMEVARRLLTRGAKPGPRAVRDFSPLHAAVDANDLEVLDLLAQAGMDVNQKEDGVPLVVFAVEMGERDLLERVLALGADINAMDGEDGYNALQIALEDGNRELAQFLMEHGATAASREGDSNYALMDIIESGDLEALKLMAKSGMDLKAPMDEDEYTPLELALEVEELAIARYLIEQGAIPLDNETAMAYILLYTVGMGEAGIMEKLLAKGADPNLRDEDGVTALHVAAEYGDLRLVELLLSKGAKPNTRDRIDGSTPLHLCMLDDPEDSEMLAVIRALLKAGADPRIEDFEGESALDYARDFDSPAVIRLLQNAKSK